MPLFAILMIEGPTDWGSLRPAEQQRLMTAYGDWVGALSAQGVFRGGWPFAGESCALAKTGDRVAVADRPADQPAETGMFLVEAGDLEAAARIARDCPALQHGETVVVHRVGLV